MPAPVVAGAAAKEVAKSLAMAAAAHVGSRMLDAIMDPGPKFDNPDPNTPISQQPANQLANNITFAPSIEISPTVATETQTALNTLAANSDNAAAFTTAMQDLTNRVNEETNTRVQNASPVDEEVLRQVGVPDTLEEAAVDDETWKKLRAIKRRNTDRLFASKEEHEWRYVRDKEKIQQVFLLAGRPYVAGGTYGTWVDTESMRRAIELVRRLRRVSHGKNAKALTSALGNSRDGLLTQLAQATVVQTKLDAACIAWAANIN